MPRGFGLGAGTRAVGQAPADLWATTASSHRRQRLELGWFSRGL